MKLAPTQRGYALALAAAAVEALTQVPQRLHWYVDLDSAGLPYDPIAPADPRHGEWLRILQGFRDYIDRQPLWKSGDRAAWGHLARLALTTDMTLASSGRRVRATFDVPWSANFTVLTSKPPPLGTWVVWPQPPPTNHGLDCEGDLTPQSADWYRAIPF